MIGTPLVMATVFSANAQAGAPMSQANPNALVCPYRNAILVDEIRFACDRIAPHLMELSIGKTSITHGPQPWNSFFPTPESRLLMQATRTIGQSYAIYEIAASNWRLPRPMYVPLGQQLLVKIIEHNDPPPAMYPALSRALVGLKCRVMPGDYRPPANVCVPWVGVFWPKGSLASVADTTSIFKSGVGELTNPFDATLHIQKLVCSGVNSGSTSRSPDIEKDESSYMMMATQRNWAQVQIYDWIGNPIVRDPTPLFHLCQPMRNEVDVDFDLPPGKTLFATMDETHVACGGTAGQYRRPSLAMVGWREVPLGEVQA